MEGDLKGIAEVDFNGKLKDLLPTLSKRARNELFDSILASESLKSPQPVRHTSILLHH